MNTPWPGPTMVTLLDGRIVFSDAEAWRHECEARNLLKLPTLEARRAMLAAVELKRGTDAAEALRATMLLIRGAEV